MSDEKVEVEEKDAPKQKKSTEMIMQENKQLEEDLAPQKTQEKEDMSVMLLEQQDRSLNIGVVGVGQCGSRLAEEFYKRGYKAAVINTALQDLKHIRVPESHKLFLDYALGGAGKEIAVGADAVEEYAKQILDFTESHTEDCEVLMLAISGGGGTGSGGAENMVKILSESGKPIMVLYVLPMDSEDALAKHNAVHTLAKLAKMAKDDVISSLTVVDNSKIELIYAGLSVSNFWKTANNAIVEPLHLFNKLSANPSEHTSLDPMDFSNVLLAGDCALYGMIEVENYEEDEAIAEAMVTNLENGLLSSHFDLSQARSAGVIITGSKEALDSVSATNIEYAFTILSKVCSDGVRVYRGVYSVPGHENKLKVYTYLSGLGLPDERVKDLKLEADKHIEALARKENDRTSAMNIDLGKTQTKSAADELHDRIKRKNSAMGKLTRNSKIRDRRRK